jgi:Zn-dependent protease
LPTLFRRLRSWTLPDLAAFAPGLPLFVPPQVASGAGPLNIVLTIVLLVICLSVHEAAHGWVAWKCGDSTAKDLGRITLNPLPHIDLFMTILLPAFLMFSQSPFVFGGAKPVPVSFHRLRHPWRDMSLVALAGPLSNLLLGIFFLVAWKFFVNTGYYNDAAEITSLRKFDLLPQVLQQAVFFNLLLTVFNLVPVPPLDGSRVMAYLLPPSARGPYVSLERVGLLIVFGLMFYPPFNSLIIHSMGALLTGLEYLVSLGGRW